MKLKTLTAAVGLFLLFSTAVKTVSAQSNAEIKWISLSEAEKLNAKGKSKKKLFVDVYTDWCGWCKRLDASTYKDPAVVKYINDNFYAVKLNAETSDTIEYKGVKYARNGSRTNPVAQQFLTGQGGYPTLTYVDEKLNVVRIAPGYVSADELLKQLRYVNDNYYLNMSYDKYVASAASTGTTK